MNHLKKLYIIIKFGSHKTKTNALLIIKHTNKPKKVKVSSS